jgi:hypothetical protein
LKEDCVLWGLVVAMGMKQSQGFINFKLSCWVIVFFVIVENQGAE